ncbi:2-isopropylmalate synthase [Caminibacter mediatlanticus TB-2]|uniref:2-isopropylmalate synthase n=1 Tax=Caminibacter mediatlanticus TB-2 TaxID=391592 RepID=A0ABX5V6T2_9BACT|nr:2-isopropylmalate synthase [Caminibacter mediatlanticus]QCT93694.1 2-isopropylmalate synthase [Caminibacter mediatlanticus TB-2]
MEMVKIFDTTLRDGEQSPGASMTIEEKIKVAKQLEKLRVDIIEAGFAAASPGDFEAINNIAKEVSSSTICSLARAVEKDIEAAAKAIDPAPLKRIHTFIATSPIHMQYKLKMTPDEVINRAVKAVEYARSFVDDVEFSCEDAGRSEMSFLKEIIDAVIKAGAKTINIPDTVGYRFPTEIGEMIKELTQTFPNVTFSVHCHNDLGLATANSLYAVLNGARQVECTINGLGERAGNAALEEIVMAIKVRRDLFKQIDTRINTKEIYPTSRLVASITGIEPQPNKAIVGRNAFAHESGIHQDGVLKHKETYEIMSAEDIGLDVKDTIVLGKHSGRHALRKKLESLGFEVSEDELNEIFTKFKKLADKKKEIYDEDILAIMYDSTDKTPKVYELVSLQLSDCSDGLPSAAAKIRYEDKEFIDAAVGEGTIDAVFKVIDRISGISGKLMDYKVEAVSEGKDALAKVMVKVIFDENKPAVMGHGLSIDTMLASARAYINALNNYVHMKDLLGKKISYKDSI